MASPNEAGIKERIMTYMNTSRRDSLEDYLRFYNNIVVAPQSAKLVDFEVDYLKLEYVDEAGSSQSGIVKINPPMASLAESRARLVSMAEEATGKSIQQSPDPLTTSTDSVATVDPLGWTFPEFPGFISLVAITFGFWSLSHNYPLSPEGPLQLILPSLLVEYSRRFREQLFAMMIGIHVIEAGIIAKKCLEQGASFPVLVLWTVDGLFEGGPAIVRINKLIKKRK